MGEEGGHSDDSLGAGGGAGAREEAEEAAADVVRRAERELHGAAIRHDPDPGRQWLEDWWNQDYGFEFWANRFEHPPTELNQPTDGSE